MNYANEIVASICTIKEMLIDREIDEKELEPLNDISDERLEEIVSSNVFKIDLDNNMVIYFDLSQKFKWGTLKSQMESDFGDDVDNKHFIIVIKSAINSSDLKKLNIQNGITYSIEWFSMQELQFNISRHELVPKHTLIKNEEEINRILTTYQVRKNQLPLILKTEPMARYLFAKPGQLVKIRRISPTAGLTIVYRCVV